MLCFRVSTELAFKKHGRSFLFSGVFFSLCFFVCFFTIIERLGLLFCNTNNGYTCFAWAEKVFCIGLERREKKRSSDLHVLSSCGEEESLDTFFSGEKDL